MDLAELQRFVDFARKKINERGPFPPRQPSRQYLTHSTECIKCGFFIPDEIYIEHYRNCRFECGLCGIRFEKSKTYQHHMQTCAAEYDRGMRGF